MDATKSPLSSLTIVSAAASALASGAQLLGVHIGPQEANTVMAGLFAIVAIYGRWRASRRISTAG